MNQRYTHIFIIGWRTTQWALSSYLHNNVTPQLISFDVWSIISGHLILRNLSIIHRGNYSHFHIYRLLSGQLEVICFPATFGKSFIRVHNISNFSACGRISRVMEYYEVIIHNARNLKRRWVPEEIDL